MQSTLVKQLATFFSFLNLILDLIFVEVKKRKM